MGTVVEDQALALATLRGGGGSLEHQICPELGIKSLPQTLIF